MSSINIKGAIERIKEKTTIFTPIVEVIVNAIQAIDTQENLQGDIKVIVKRSGQLEVDGSLPSIESIDIIDNGIGFTDENRESFDTLFSDYKIEQGGKGFGRFTCLKYFDGLHIDSNYFDIQEGIYKRRTFSMGKKKDIIIDEKITHSESKNTGTSVTLSFIKNRNLLNKTLQPTARSLVEKLLPYFITKDYTCPEITLMEEKSSDSILLNSFTKGPAATIHELTLDESVFCLGQGEQVYEFEIKVFKIYSPKKQTSKISLVADKREVVDNPISNYIPEFIDEFYDKKIDGSDNTERNYIIKSYVFGKYLDNYVSLERGEFEFPKDSDILYPISQSQIESKAAEITKNVVLNDISTRLEKKQKRILSYVENDAPWHKNIVNNIDLSGFPYNPSDEEIETRLQQEKFQQEIKIKNEVNTILKDENVNQFNENLSEIVAKISESSKNDLIHYITIRRKVLELFKKSLEVNTSGKYSSESLLHDIIFPRKKDSDTIQDYEHNLWIIDERLNFSSYISSDLPLKKGKRIERPDLIVYNRRVAFRGDNESSNPVTIFEFKKPDRDDFVNPSSKEDPIEQIKRYVNSIKDGQFTTPEGRSISIADNTPFYGYVICDISKKVDTWLYNQKDFKKMPDGMGWFDYFGNINLYIEVLSWEKLLKDADMRNKIFFHKLGLS